MYNKVILSSSSQEEGLRRKRRKHFVAGKNTVIDEKHIETDPGSRHMIGHHGRCS